MDASYLIEGFVAIDGIDNPIVLDSMFRSIEIINDYDNNVFPILRLNVELDFESYYLIQKNDSCKFSITIKKYKHENLESNDTTIFTYYMKNKIFIPVDKDISPINMPEGLNSVTDQIPSLRTTFLLMSEEDLSNNKRLVNTVLKDSDIESTILYLAQKFPSKPIIFEKPDNQIIYDQIILPPNNIIRSMKYLDTVYGIYNYGLRIFLDFNAYYIINKHDNSNLPVLEGKYKNTHIKVVSDTAEGDSLFYNDTVTESGNFYSAKVHISNIKFINYSDSRKEFLGTHNIIISQSNSDIVRNDYGTNEIKTRVYYNRYNNKHKEKEIVTNSKKGIFLTCTLDAIDIDAISCNNQFYFNFAANNYSNYSGEYHILKSSSIFNVGSNGYSDLQAKLYFKKK
ncbi:hypothetical protein Goe21_02360 [Bacillus phage vB_BsuM-Goe21]|nr:hypothetical protein Goe21_02360 [Bacillus phage vB_BsuM-Goe21]